MASDLIDRKEFIKKFCGEQCGCARKECGYEYVEDGHDACFIIEEIEKVSSVDAVEVVRCKNCAKRGGMDCPKYHSEYSYGYEFTDDNTTDDGFCDEGVKKDETD